QTILDCAKPLPEPAPPRPQRLPTAAACASLLDFTIYNVQDPSPNQTHHRTGKPVHDGLRF
ncbi:hypothetical protein, partial [Azospirillum picis]|uniref:hypothetical protein n=1 Tax=Azospirillum picis TaxID=488438 RepID=UPI001AE8E0B2